VLILAAIYDLKERRIPNWLTVGGALCAGLAWAIDGGLECAGMVAGLAGLAAAAPNLVRPRQVGAGDVKLAAVLGALLGFTDVIAVLGVGAILALGVLLLIRVRRGNCRRPRAVAFAPFLLGGFAVVGVAGG
jgi:leader peptidase (prepilin peptidase)/N-methyltransferase